MSVIKDDLTSEVCHVVLTKLAYLAGSGQEEALREVGMSDKEIARLERLSLNAARGEISYLSISLIGQEVFRINS
ncbi:hypothetical protein, partial [uncultured Vibrio sp.]|uniref:hypothetical protein n=1 Tax=uncultured Vibrio sp. TaxID=114054 RepID=UPI00261447F4